MERNQQAAGYAEAAGYGHPSGSIPDLLAPFEMGSRRSRLRGMETWQRMSQQNLAIASVVAQVADEDDESNRPRRGSVVGRRTVHRNRFEGYRLLMSHYFLDPPVYDDNVFRRRFRMTKQMYLDICHAVAAKDDYFKRKINTAGLPGFATVQKVTAALRVLAYGGAADRLDEYLQMGKTTILETVNHFTRAVVAIYGSYYLREPNENDIAWLLQVAEQRGFPGMLGSLDCMHWEWERYPNALHDQYRGHFKKLTVILEAVASSNLWVWHAFFGLPGSMNDINVLHRSPLFDKLASGNGPKVNYSVNGTNYDMGYYLADGIYPPWATLIGPIPSPQSIKQKHFVAKQVEYRKDVERAFGVIQTKYAIMKGPARLWDVIDLKYIVDCVIILHNMGILYEHDMEHIRLEDYDDATTPSTQRSRNVPEIEELIRWHQRIQSRPVHEHLKSDLIEHVWLKYGPQEMGLQDLDSAS